jgi:AAA ATPase domain
MPGPPISLPAIRPDLLLEREQHLHVLQDAFSRASSGNGCTVLVAGEAGIGKTTLVEHFIACLDQDVKVLKGACDALSTPTALGPLFDIAQQLGGAMAERLKETAPRPALFASVLESIGNRNGTTVLFVEDLHWADHATLDLVRFLARRTIDRRTLLIFTLRDDEIGAVHPLRPVLGDLARQRSVMRLKPALLSIEAVATMIGGREQSAEDVHRKTGGNPFYVTEVIGQAGSAIPSTVRDAVLARAARLSKGARQLVELVSVVGARVDNALLERIEWISPEQTEEAVGAGSLVAREPGLGFRHELARMAIFESIDPLQRRSLFRQVLRSAADVPDLVTSAQLAHYAEGAGDAAAVVRHGLQAAKAAAALGAHREAASHYKRVLAFSQDRSASERAGMIEALAREWAIVDNLDEAIGTYRAAIALRAEAGDTLREGADWADLAWPLVRSGQNAAADDASRRAIQVLRGLPASKELAGRIGFRRT